VLAVPPVLIISGENDSAALGRSQRWPDELCPRIPNEVYMTVPWSVMRVTRPALSIA